MLNRHDSRCPIVRRGPTQIARRVDVSGGLGHYQTVRFAQPIVWLRESEASLCIHNGSNAHPVGSTHSDFYGFLTSPIEHIAAFPEVALREDITADSRRELVVLVTITDTPMIEDLAVEPVGGMRCYRSVPRDWMAADHPGLDAYLAAKPDERAAMENPFLAARTPRQIVILSSRWTSEERAGRESAAIAAAVEDLERDLADAARDTLRAALRESA